MDNRYKETFETWNNIASIYEDKFMNLDLYNNTYNIFCNAIHQPNSKILEIGCGPGNITKYLLSKRPDFEILGIDISPNMIKLAKKNNPKASFEFMDCREISMIKTKYDGIISGFCLPYLSHIDSEKFISDAHHLLQENGIFYLSFIEGNPNKSKYLVNSKGDRVYFYYYDLEQIKNQLLKYSFGDHKIFKVEYKKSDTEREIHTILIAKKFKTV